MDTFKNPAASLLVFLTLAACSDPPPPPPPPPTDAGPRDAGSDDAGPVDSGLVDGGSVDGGADAGMDGMDAGAFDAGPPPASGPFADLVVSGQATGSYRLVPPANTLICQEVGADDGYIALSMHPDGVGRDALEIDIFGPVVVGSYDPVTGRARRGEFGMIYRSSPTSTFLIDTTSRPCTFEVTSLAGGMLEATFDCSGLVNLTAPGEGVHVSGRVRCNYP